MEILSKKKPGGIVDYRWAILMLAVLGLLGLLVIIFWIKETGPKKRAESP
jgi:predicted MFS family arabinose efflux permease